MPHKHFLKIWSRFVAQQFAPLFLIFSFPKLPQPNYHHNTSSLQSKCQQDVDRKLHLRAALLDLSVRDSPVSSLLRSLCSSIDYLPVFQPLARDCLPWISPLGRVEEAAEDEEAGAIDEQIIVGREAPWLRRMQPTSAPGECLCYRLVMWTILLSILLSAKLPSCQWRRGPSSSRG